METYGPPTQPTFDPSQPSSVLPVPSSGSYDPVFEESKPFVEAGQPQPPRPNFGVINPQITIDDAQFRRDAIDDKKGFLSWVTKPFLDAGKALPFATELEMLVENELTKANAAEG